jgi:transposase
VAYEVFSGSTFEGNTILPVVKEFIKKHAVKEFTVVADAAMISAENVRELLKNDISYIVGARLGNINAKLIEQIDKSLPRQDGEDIRIKTDNGFLICSYSAARYRKDKYEMDKQIEKAKALIERPSKNKKLKFTKSSGEKIEINEALIEKTKKLLGVKGYYTNLGEEVVNNKMVIERYHELYKIEQAFRISKNDLQTRPIFHFKEQPIKLHILICFMALVISKHIELDTRQSIRKFIIECKKITDARIFNQITGKEMRIRTKLTPEIVKIMQSLNLPH